MQQLHINIWSNAEMLSLPFYVIRRTLNELTLLFFSVDNLLLSTRKNLTDGTLRCTVQAFITGAGETVVTSISTEKQLQLILPSSLHSLAQNLTAGSPGVFSEWLLNSNSKILICKRVSDRQSQTCQSSALLWFPRNRHITKITEKQTLS